MTWSGHVSSGRQVISWAPSPETSFQTSPLALQTASPPIEVQPGSSAAAFTLALVWTVNVTTAGLPESMYPMVTLRVPGCDMVTPETSGMAAVATEAAMAATNAVKQIGFFIVVGSFAVGLRIEGGADSYRTMMMKAGVKLSERRATPCETEEAGGATSAAPAETVANWPEESAVDDETA